MRPEFEKIYRELDAMYRVTQSSGEPSARSAQVEALAITTDVIDRAVKVFGRVELRPDARLHLLVNLHQMVVLPISHGNSPVRIEDVRNEIVNDTVAILTAAVKSAGDRSRSDIAASHLVWGTAEVLDRLSLKKWRLWERE